MDNRPKSILDNTSNRPNTTLYLLSFLHSYLDIYLKRLYKYIHNVEAIQTLYRTPGRYRAGPP